MIDMPETINFKSRDLLLEGRLHRGSNNRAAIITHPHPLYGGDMDNAVVAAIAKAYAQKGWAVLRFNFRGAGNSQGHYDDGQGEQEDVQAAIGYLNDQGYQQIDLTGYSFGAWVLALWAQQHDCQAHRMLMVSPPVAFIDFKDVGPIPGLYQVMAGSLDEIAPPSLINRLLPHWHPNAELHVIQGADHFFGGHLDTLQQLLMEAIE